ncbi:hypothetical protein P5V30_20780 [Mycobacteroides abscessus subsp. abscessus]|uniref:hypothetical protein n=1 Tax=Mycobacteroides abscessus TaxID=36809 RepID=UPI0009260065|nr:hypothetical protein [Mycobacteroides abscessus]MDO2986970.1 hypothetical protein [Mycobacteroides abscessus subsp. abscessus]SID31540.1 Uncharacterised protein [Mycobacteroides abscessus subsp. abscessus]SIJ92405.1 Uncharacterised protein [Mycobacteroides abscessus subsp. abscessus]
MPNAFTQRRMAIADPLAVVADAIAVFMPEGDSGQDGELNADRAESILTALGCAGWEVTRRPTTYRIDPPGYPD